MPRFIVELRNPADDSERALVVWSTVVDAPITYGMSEGELAEYICEEYGTQGLADLPNRLARVRKHGTSLVDGTTWSEAIKDNRASPGETELTAAELWNAYVVVPRSRVP